MPIRLKTLFHIIFLLLAFTLKASFASEAGWSTLASGDKVVFIRHAVTEAGIGDPAGFLLGDCKTQRNLSEKGRADAKRLGEEFRNRKIPVAEVLSSRWCRCIDTATLAFNQIGQVAMLDSMFNDRVKPEKEKIQEVHAYASKHARSGNLVFVTHAQNIQTHTGVSPATGEIIVTRFEGDGFKVVARIAPPY